MRIEEWSPDDLIGPLNEVEQKYAPKTLYLAGSLSHLQRGARVSIVGSRNASDDGVRRARKLSAILSSKGIVVVSGLADGIDTAAHTSAIESGGRTIAVIGTPLDKSYPVKNAKLQSKIADEHLLISQFPSGYPTKPGCFPMRNRTMALLSDATVIIEASDSSGTISQAWEALRLGRELFLAKSLVEAPDLTWPAEVLRFGARVLADESIDLFLETLPPRLPEDVDVATPY